MEIRFTTVPFCSTFGAGASEKIACGYHRGDEDPEERALM